MTEKTKIFTSANFKAEVLEADKPVLVDFWAPWCGPCRMIAPAVDEIAKEYDGKAIVGKVDVDVSPDLAKQYGVMTIPTIILFKAGKQKDQVVGLTNKAALTKLMADHL